MVNRVIAAIAAGALMLSLTACMSGSEHFNVAESCPAPPSPAELPSDTSEAMNEFARENLRFGTELIGLREAQAEACLTNVGLSWRVVARDGEMFPATLDYRYNRVNLSIINGEIVDVNVG